MKYPSTIQKYANLGSFVLISSTSFVVFGDEDNNDMILVGNFKTKIHDTSLFHDNVKVDVGYKECDKLLESALALTYSSANAMFLITDDEIKLIKSAINDVDATHIRIHAENNKVRISVFDYRKFIESTRINRKQSQKLLYLEMDDESDSEFSHTINANSFNKLPVKDYLVRVGDNSICEFAPMNENVKYLFRDQQIIEPLTTFYSTKVNQSISFVFHPKSLNEDLDTSQSFPL